MFIVYLIIGAISGTIAGLIGIGGGIIVVPALAGVFMHYQIMPNLYIMHMAIGTSLAAMIVTLVSALRSHVKLHNVRWDLVKILLPGLMIGSLSGALVAHLLPSSFLKEAFSIFLGIVSLRLLFSKQEEPDGQLPSKILMMATSAVIGLLSSILGAGGGTMLIPFMLRCRVQIRQAAGTSVACGVFIGVVATTSFMALGSTQVGIKWSTGYIYWPAFFGVGFSSMIFAPLGTIWGHKIPTDLLKRLFAGLLMFLAIDMFFSH